MATTVSMIPRVGIIVCANFRFYNFFKPENFASSVPQTII